MLSFPPPRSSPGFGQFTSACLVSLICSLLLCLGLPGRAVPPLVTDDAVATEKDTFEIYSGFSYESGNGSIERAIATSELDYGLTERQEISVALPYFSTDGERGFGDMILATRFVVIKESDTLPCISTSFEWKLRNGSVARGLGTGKFDYNFVLATQKTWRWFTAYVETNFDFVGNPEIDGVTGRRYNQWFAGFAQQYQISKKFDILTEIYCQRAEEPGLSNQFAAGIGFEWEFAHGLALQGEIGRSLREGSRGGPDLRAYVGLHWTFDAPWKKDDKDKSK